MKFKVHSISSKSQVWEETALEFYKKRLHDHELIFLNHKHKLLLKNPEELIVAESKILLNKVEKIDDEINYLIDSINKLNAEFNLDELIQNLKDGNNVGANKQFNTVMADKMTAALDAKKIEIASGMIQRKAEEKQEEE